MACWRFSVYRDEFVNDGLNKGVVCNGRQMRGQIGVEGRYGRSNRGHRFALDVWLLVSVAPLTSSTCQEDRVRMIGRRTELLLNALPKLEISDEMSIVP